MRTSVLFINLEFTRWKRGRHLSYAAQLGLEEGLAANGVDYFTLPTTWIKRAKGILAGRKFDQVWLELVHTDLNEDFYKWLSALAPVRVGFLLESAEYSADEYKRHPFLKGRTDLIRRRLNFMTHLVACDERDAENFSRVIPSFWWPQAVP